MSKYDAAQWSSVPGKPSFESCGYNRIAIIPLMAHHTPASASNMHATPNSGGRRNSPSNNYRNFSEQSFHFLMNSLQEFAKRTSNPSHSLNVSEDASSGNATPKQESKPSPKDTQNSNDSNTTAHKWKQELNETILVIPNSKLTRPSDWRYDHTPFKCFDWTSGCQRLLLLDGRPDHSRLAHDSMVNPILRYDLSDLNPSRQVMAIIGVLNCQDCASTQDLLMAQQELERWAKMYSSSSEDDLESAEKLSEKQIPIRMFVFDSFDEKCQRTLDFTSTNMGSHLVAFPPIQDWKQKSSMEHHLAMIQPPPDMMEAPSSDKPDDKSSNLASLPQQQQEQPYSGQHMMDQTLNVIMNELAVAIFRRNEAKIKQVDNYAKSSGTFKFQFPNFSFGTGTTALTDPNTKPSTNSIQQNHPTNALKAAMDRAFTTTTTTSTRSIASTSSSTSSQTTSALTATSPTSPFRAQKKQYSQSPNSIPFFLFTPLDDISTLHYTKLPPKDLDHFKKQQMGRREKLAGDYCLLAGSPLDAYERYSNGMDFSKSSQDPLWYAASVEGCATAYIAMADAGGQGVDDYLDRNFKLPEEVMALANFGSDRNGMSLSEHKKHQAADRTKTTLPAAILNLCEEALAIFCRHKKLAPLYAELLLKLAKYTAEKEEAHLHCQWGVGEGCYGGDGNYTSGEDKEKQRSNKKPSNKHQDTNSRKPQNRWEHSLKSHLALGNLGSKGKEYSQLSSLSRCQQCADLLQKAVSAGALDPRTRADVAVTCARICLEGVKSSHWGDFNNASIHTTPRMRLPRKAAFFTTMAAEAMTICSQLDSLDAVHLWRATSLWLAASNLYARDGNGVAGCTGNYGWATLRASALHGLSQMHQFIASEQASELLILLLSEISPNYSSDAERLMKINAAVATEEESNLGTGGENHHHHGNNIVLDSEIKLGDGEIAGVVGGSVGGGIVGGVGTIPESSNDVKEFANVTSNKAKNTRKHNLVTKSPFFMQMAPSSFVLAQSKWLENDPIPDVDLPLLDAKATTSLLESLSLTVINEKDSTSSTNNGTFSSSSPISNMLSLNCIVPRVKFETCANAQSQYISDLIDLRARMPTSSYPRGGSNFSIYGPPKPVPSHLRNTTTSKSNTSTNGDGKSLSTVPPPLLVISASMIKSESNLLLEQTKAAGYTGKVANASMATFFNPYDNKRKEDEKKPNQVTLVAEGEERIIVAVFSNLLSVPLEVPSCHLEFDRGIDKIEAPSLSFTIPARCKDFHVRFPFEVLATQQRTEDDHSKRKQSNDKEGSNSVTSTDKYELIGVRITCMNRPYFITFDNIEKNRAVVSMDALVYRQLPEPASLYQLSNHTKQENKQAKEVSVKIESVPAQPNLLVSFTTSLTPMDDNATVPVHLSDGEIYSIPPLRLENNFGSSGLGKMERLQIICVGLPGLQDEILFDTDKEAAARGEDVFLDSDSDVGSSDDFQELMEYDGLPPLKMKANTEGLSLESINEKSKSQEGSVVTFQIAATHDMGNSLANGGHVRIRFRYRGPSPNPATEIWRRREISLRILRVKGPRISSLSFRSDLSWGSVFSELSKTLAYQKQRRLSQPKSEAVAMEIFRKSLYRPLTKEDGVLSLQANLDDIEDAEEKEESPNDDYILERIGMDQGVHVSGDEVVVLMAVANETSNTIILSNRKGRVGGFEASPMSTVRVTSGVSVKIPVVIQRIDRRDENGNIADIAAELIARTALQWESEVNEGGKKDNKRVRHGRVRIPSRCLREIIGEHQSFASRICESPVTVNINIGRREGMDSVQIYPGLFLDTSMEVNIREWIPTHVLTKCTFEFEFCCAKKGPGTLSYDSDNDPDYIWCGQIRRIVRRGGEDMKTPLTHRSRISFVQNGTYVISACVKIIAEGHSCEEIWWAPKAETVVVMKMSS